jgi:coproporphyrinogen III oxidase
LRRSAGHRAGPCASSVAVTTSHTTSSFEEFILEVQNSITAGAEALDGAGQHFRRDRWERSSSDPGAGFGITAVMEGGDLLEKAAVNISVIAGTLTPER